VQRREVPSGARPPQAEELRPEPQARGGRREDAGPDRLAAVPEEYDPADEGEVVAAVMPPSEVRPVAAGAVRQPKLVRETDRFFFTCRRSNEMAPSPRQWMNTSGLRFASTSSCVVA